ncbi:MAG: hypothetical protein IT355_13120 [Gemmatimonadaceae bacterium]|nr:hypothetical protein [Gemmatimonadaceae bacterium]
MEQRTTVQRTIRRRMAQVTLVALVMFPMAVRPAAAQQVASNAPVRLSIEELTAQWASLERPLLGVTELTDLQRDAIELLEEKYRKLFNDEAGPIRAARSALLQNSQNFARQDVERALSRMAALRKRELELLRTILTDAQRVRYDENLKVLDAEEEDARLRRAREEAFYTP